MSRSENWLFVAPVDGVFVTSAVQFEYQICRVTLVDKTALSRVVSALGVSRPIHENNPQGDGRINQVLTESKTFAVFRQDGEWGDTRAQCLKIARDELMLLALSQLGYHKRTSNASPVLGFKKHDQSEQALFLDTGSDRTQFHHKITDRYGSIVLDGRWKEYQQENFFEPLMNILRGQTRVSKAWQKDLRNAAILAGQSQCSSDLPQAFLWNMIALELLLTSQDDKYSTELPKRAEAFLGWIGFWETENYPSRIKDLYSKRCRLVHNGEQDIITVDDLLFSDDLLLNLFLNIASHPDLFQSKRAVIHFSDRVQAERLLEVPPQVRPKTMSFISRQYSATDREDLKQQTLEERPVMLCEFSFPIAL